MTSTRQMIITLFVVALVCSVVLSFVYSFTAPVIENTQKELILASLKEVIVAAEFIEVVPETLWEAQDSAGNLVGIVFRVFPQGYAASIPITVGLDREGNITGIRIATAGEGMKETPGLGAKILESNFKDLFIGKAAPQVQLKQDGGEIDGITAATISSRAVCSGVKKGIEKYAQQLNTVPDMKVFFPDADKYIAIVEDTLWYAVRNNDTLGIVFIGVAQGWLNKITFIVGVDRDKKIVGVDILESRETEGLGEKIRDKEWLDQFKEGTPDVITGATKSAQAVIDGVDKNIVRFEEYLR